MKQKKTFGWLIFAGSIVAICLLCCGGPSLPLYVFPLIPEPLAEELRQDADRLSHRYKSPPGEPDRALEIQVGEWTPAIRSLNPRRVFLFNNELYVGFDGFLGLGRGIVIVPEGFDRPYPLGDLRYQPLQPCVFRYVARWD